MRKPPVTKFKMQGLTGLELLAAIAAVAIAAVAAVIAYYFVSEKSNEIAACVGTLSTPQTYAEAWAPTIRSDPPTGNKMLCELYKTSAEAWNAQCADDLSPLPVPEVCQDPT